MNFEEELRKGNFVISECHDCKKIIWPPSEFCNQCFNENTWRKSSKIGKIIECSKKDNVSFCVAEIENSVRVIGDIISGEPDIGKKVEIAQCGVSNGDYFIKLKVIE